MFEKFFGKKNNNEPRPELPKDINPSPVKKPEFKMEDFLVSKNKDRVIFRVPITIFNAVGGRDVLTRDIFPKLFNGSHPAWSTNSSNEYLIEIPDDEEKIEEFKRRILARISE